MINQITDFVLLSSDDFVKQRVSTEFNSVATSDMIVDDTFYFNSQTRVLTAQSSNTKSGMFSFYFSNLNIGDIIEVECEMRSVSGHVPQIYVGEVSVENNSGTEANTTYRETLQQGQWEFINLSYLVKNITYNHGKVSIGITTSRTGKYQIKNLKVRLRRNTFVRKSDLNRRYCISKYNGNWVYDNYSSSDIPIISVVSGTLKITFDVVYKKSPIALVTPFNTLASQYRIIAQATSDSVTITFLDNTNAVVPVDTIVNNNTKFYLVVFGEI